MRRITKNLIISGILLAGWTFAFCKYAKGEYLKEGRFTNYKTSNSFLAPEQDQKKGFIKVEYDLNGDLKPDVAELYKLSPFGISENPISYWLDLNRNHKIEKNELWLDKKMDGLNGNEEQQKNLEDYI